MKTLTLYESKAQAPACFDPAPVSGTLPPCQDPGHVIKTRPNSNVEAVAMDVAAERLELLRTALDAQARHHWQRGEEADGMADWLKSAALRLAIRTLQTRLDGAGAALFRPVSFDYARHVLWNAANEWAQIAGLSLSIPDPETHGSALTNAAALRYAAQLLANELPATESALAA